MKSDVFLTSNYVRAMIMGSEINKAKKTMPATLLAWAPPVLIYRDKSSW